MFRVKTAGLFALPVALMLVLWLFAIPSADVIDEGTARFAGLSLLGIALLSTILVFCSAAKEPASAPRRAVAPAGRAGNEFRRGFASTGVATPALKSRVAVARPNEVIPVRRRHVEPRIGPGKLPGPIEVAPARPAAHATIASVKQRLEHRAQELWRRQTG